MAAQIFRILTAIYIATIFLFSVPTSSLQLYTAYRVSRYDTVAGVYAGGPGVARPGARYCPGSFVYNNEFWLYGGYGIADGSKYHYFLVTVFTHSYMSIMFFSLLLLHFFFSFS